MRIGFRYPPVERGVEINIVSGTFFGIKGIYANGEKAKTIDKSRGQYSYYDPTLGRERRLGIAMNLIDYPQFYIDGREYKLFPSIPSFFKFYVFAPVIYCLFWDPSVIFFSFILAVINIFLNVSLLKILRSNIMRVIFIGMMTGVGGFLTYVVVNVFYEIFVDLNWITPSTSSAAAMIVDYLKLLIK